LAIASARSSTPRRSSIDTSTPIWASSRSMVLTSFSCGMLPRRSGSRVSRAAHMIGSAAFLAPEMRTSPASGTPPSMTSLSMRFLRRERAHRKRVDLLAHALPEGRVHHLVPLHPALPPKRFAHHERLEMLTVSRDAHFPTRQALLDVTAQL